VTHTYDFSSDYPQTVRPTQITVTPVIQEEAGRIGFRSLRGFPGRSFSVRGFAGTTASRGRDVLHPVILISRGLRRFLVWFLAWWKRSDRERRRTVLVAAGLIVTAVVMLPRGPWILAGVIMASAALAGRAPRTPPDTAQQRSKLQVIYNGLVPYFTDPHDPDRLFQPGEEFTKAFDRWHFDDRGRLLKLDLHYSPYFMDGEPEARAKIEQAIERKTGVGGDYLYEWDEEGNRLSVAVLPRPDGQRAPAGRPEAPAANV
jgi:hypothetical protein